MVRSDIVTKTFMQPLPTVVTGGMMGVTRLLIADASDALRLGLRMIFSLDPSVSIVADLDCADALRDYVCALRPDVVVYDADMAGADRVIDATRLDAPDTVWLALTMQTSDRFRALVIEQGASACIEKRASPLELLDAFEQHRPRPRVSPN
jgi:DNA-binding NarL/FixJ family response regulator